MGYLFKGLEYIKDFKTLVAFFVVLVVIFLIYVVRDKKSRNTAQNQNVNINGKNDGVEINQSREDRVYYRGDDNDKS